MMPRLSAQQIAGFAIIVLALAGAWASGTLLKNHDGGWRVASNDGGVIPGPCEWRAPESPACAAVVGSRWGSFDLFSGSRRILVPTSLVGLAYFVSIVIWFSMLGRPAGWSAWIWRPTVLLLSGGVASSVFLLAVMGVTLSEWCPLCIAAHGVNLGIFIVAIWLWRRVRRERRGTAAHETVALGTGPSQQRLAFLAAAVALTASGGIWLHYDAVTQARHHWRKHEALNRLVSALQQDAGFLLREFHAQPVRNIPLRGGHGGTDTPRTATAPIELIVFTDYDARRNVCFEATLAGSVPESLGHGVRVDVRHRPQGFAEELAARTNVLDDPGLSGLRASLAAEAARLQGGDAAFARMHHLLFQHRNERPHRQYADLARLAGLDADALLADMAGEVVRQVVERDVALAERLGVTSTPAAFLNGRRVPELCLQSPTFWRAIGAELTEGRRSVCASVETERG